MARFLIIWHINPTLFPDDPEEYAKFIEKVWAGIDDLIKKGVVEEMGAFLDGMTGFAIANAESRDVYRILNMHEPYWDFEVNEIISYEDMKEEIRSIWKAQAEA